MTDNNSYKTDRFGTPDDRNYHYRIPLNNDCAMRLASWALNSVLQYQNRFVVEWDGYSGDKLAYMGIKTHDSKGHLIGLEEYAHSPKWKNMGVMSDIDEYRQNPTGSGTQVKGSFRVDPMSFNGVQKLSFKTVVNPTPTELKEAYEQRGDTWDTVIRTIEYAKDESMEQARKEIHNKQQSCEHEHSVFPENHIGKTRDSDGYCEDCGTELTKNKELTY